jgi:hypothetical protein
MNILGKHRDIEDALGLVDKNSVDDDKIVPEFVLHKSESHNFLTATDASPSRRHASNKKRVDS